MQRTRQDVLDTIDSLRRDLENNPDEWENPSLESYLEAMGAWLRDWGDKHDPVPSWDLMCDLLQAARIYE